LVVTSVERASLLVYLNLDSVVGKAGIRLVGKRV
jgi:hypothetical protein